MFHSSSVKQNWTHFAASDCVWMHPNTDWRDDLHCVYLVIFSAIIWSRGSMRARPSSALHYSTRRRVTPFTRTRWVLQDCWEHFQFHLFWWSNNQMFPFSLQMGEAHEKTKESSEYLKYLTQQAVALQRTMNEIYKNGSNASIMPLKVTCSVLTHVFVLQSLSSQSFNSDAMFLFPPSFFFCSSLLPAWPVSWNSSTLSTASSLYHWGKVRNLQRHMTDLGQNRNFLHQDKNLLQLDYIGFH